MIHPIINICKAIPEEDYMLDGEFLDKLNSALVFNGVFVASSRDEIFYILKEILTELDIAELSIQDKNKMVVKQGNTAKRIIKEYG